MQLKNLVLAMAVATPLLFAGCDVNEGPAEEAGENVDEAIDRTGEAVEDAGDKIRDEVNR